MHLQSRSIIWAAAAAMPFRDHLVSKGPHSRSAVLLQSRSTKWAAAAAMPFCDRLMALLQCSALTGPVDCVDRSSCPCPYLVTLSQCNVLVVPVDYLGRCRHNARCLRPLSKQRTALSQCSALAKPVDYLGRSSCPHFLSAMFSQSQSIMYAAVAAQCG